MIFNFKMPLLVSLLIIFWLASLSLSAVEFRNAPVSPMSFATSQKYRLPVDSYTLLLYHSAMKLSENSEQIKVDHQVTSRILSGSLMAKLESFPVNVGIVIEKRAYISKGDSSYPDQPSVESYYNNKNDQVKLNPFFITTLHPNFTLGAEMERVDSKQDYKRRDKAGSLVLEQSLPVGKRSYGRINPSFTYHNERWEISLERRSKVRIVEAPSVDIRRPEQYVVGGQYQLSARWNLAGVFGYYLWNPLYTTDKNSVMTTLGAEHWFTSMHKAGCFVVYQPSYARRGETLNLWNLETMKIVVTFDHTISSDGFWGLLMEASQGKGWSTIETVATSAEAAGEKIKKNFKSNSMSGGISFTLKL